MNLRELLQDLPANLANHLLITVIPLVLGIGISLPLAVLVLKFKPLRFPTLTIVSV